MTILYGNYSDGQPSTNGKVSTATSDMRWYYAEVHLLWSFESEKKSARYVLHLTYFLNIYNWTGANLYYYQNTLLDQDSPELW